MDSIDIRDSAFSLENPGINDVITTLDELTDYNMFIYIGAAILVLFIVIFVYKYYSNKKTTDNNESDCPGGFCTMNNQPPSTSNI